MQSIEKKIEIEAPLSEVYNRWTHFEEFPRFMEGVESVKQVDEKHLHWVVQIGGQKKEWDAELVEQVPNQKIAWQSTQGAVNSGEISFRANDPKHTIITLRMAYEPQGVMERMGSSLGLLSRRIEGDLESFRHYIQDHPEVESENQSISQNKLNLPTDYDTSGKSGV